MRNPPRGEKITLWKSLSCLGCGMMRIVTSPHLVHPIINSLPVWKCLPFLNTVLCRRTPCARRIITSPPAWIFLLGLICLQTRTCLEIRNPCLYVRKSVLKFWHWLIISDYFCDIRASSSRLMWIWNRRWPPDTDHFVVINYTHLNSADHYS